MSADRVRGVSTGGRERRWALRILPLYHAEALSRTRARGATLCRVWTKRLGVILALLGSGLAAPVPADGQGTGKVYRLAILGSTRPLAGQLVSEPLVKALSDLGYTEGRNIVFDVRYAEDKPDRFPEFAADLLRLKTDVILAVTEPAVQAAKKATSTVPIVMVLVGDPVQTGLVASLARPGGNVTGLTTLVPQLAAKRLDLLVELTRRPARIAFLRRPAAVNAATVWDDVRSAGRQLDIPIIAIEANERADVERALAEMARSGATGLLVDAVPTFFLERRRIIDFAVAHRMPAVYGFRQFVDADGLMSYGPDFLDQFRRAATYISKILKGAVPGEIPVEQPTKFELVLNLRTARMIGLTIPPALQLRADHVIE